ncbi:MAG: hypothetical protein QJR02_07210 [Sinobacteraceae bacterium]|nr:hypothetical protein [Nevskiaceae bacterium]
MNLRIVAVNAADDATISASPAAQSDLLEINLQTAKRGEVCRVLGTSCTFDVELPSGRTIGCVALVRHNFSPTAKWQIRFYSDAQLGGALVYDTGLVYIDSPIAWGSFSWGDGPWARNRYSGWPQPCAIVWPSRISARSLSIAISDPDNADGFLQAARLFVGDYLSPATNVSWGVKLTWKDDSEQVRTDGGSLIGDARETYRQIVMSCDWLTDDERAQFSELARIAGKSRDVLLSVYPQNADPNKERDYQFAAKYSDTPDMVSPFFGYHAHQMTFTET